MTTTNVLRCFAFAAIASGCLAQPAPAVDTPEMRRLRAELVARMWRYDHPARKDAELRFAADGTCASSPSWDGAWKITGSRSVEIVMRGSGKKAQLFFSDDLLRYSGIHFDGVAIRGRRAGDVPLSARK